MTTDETLPPRKELLLQAGKRLILTKGYTATTVDEICDEAGITKGGFYYFFKNKETFASELLAYNWLPIQQTQENLVTEGADALHILYEHIDFMVAFIPTDGRLMGILAQELSQTHPQVGEQVSGYFHQWTEILTQIITVAKEQYAPDADFTPQSMMEFILMTIEGVPVVHRQLGAEAVPRALTHLKAYIAACFHASH